MNDKEKVLAILTKRAGKILKALAFVEHIERHLQNDIQFSKHAKVMCKICNKTIDEIYEKEQEGASK